MKLRFEVDQAEAFRRGIDCPKSIVTIEVDPATIPQADRDLIADRMEGIDVVAPTKDRGKARLEDGTLMRIKAELPTFDSFMQAVRESEEWVLAREAEAAKAQRRH